MFHGNHKKNCVISIAVADEFASQTEMITTENSTSTEYRERDKMLRYSVSPSPAAVGVHSAPLGVVV